MNKLCENPEVSGIPRIKVVIPMLNEERNIGALIDRIVAENVPCDIVVVDNTSEDRSAEIVKARKAAYVLSHPEISIELVYEQERGVANARNVGALHKLGEKQHDYIFFLDADVGFHPGFFQNAVSEMRDKGLDMAGCLLQPSSGMLIDQVAIDIYNNVLKIMEHTGNNGCVGAGMVARPDIFGLTGGFDTDMKIYEDTDWAKRVGRAGKAGMLSRAPIIFSTRRLDKEGRLHSYMNYLVGGIYYLLTGKARKGMKYEFGKF